MENRSIYCLVMLGGLLLTAGAFRALLGKRHGAGKLCVLSAVFGLVFGALLSKLVYYLTQLDFMIAMGWLESLTDTEDPAAFSYYGGVLGVLLGVVLAAKLLHHKPVEILNRFAPAGLLMAAIARFAEYWLEGVGLGEYVEEESALCFFPAAVPFTGDGWTEWYIAVFILEGLATLIIGIVSLCCLKRDRFIRSLFYLCLPQILLENLRSDGIRWLFVRVEQLFCMIALLAVLVIYGIKAEGKHKRWMPAITALCCAGLFVAMEFAMEGKISFLEWMDVPMCFIGMGIGCVALLLAEISGWRRWRKE